LSQIVIASLVPAILTAKNRIGLLSFRISNAIFAYRKITQFTTGEETYSVRDSNSNHPPYRI